MCINCNGCAAVMKNSQCGIIGWDGYVYGVMVLKILDNLCIRFASSCFKCCKVRGHSYSNASGLNSGGLLTSRTLTVTVLTILLMPSVAVTVMVWTPASS